MARPVNRQCIECSRLPVDDARQRPCWTDERQRCHKRRSHYLKRGDRNVSRRVRYRSSRTANTGEAFSLPNAPTASLILVIYSEQPSHFKSGETPVHALGAELWVGLQLKEQMVPELCCGKRGDEVALLPPLILEEFSKRFAQTHNQNKRFQRFAAKVHRHIQDCPVANPFQPNSGSAAT
jgi:hypothetical protein